MQAKEKRVILLIAKMKLTDEEVNELGNLMKTHLDWSKIYGMLHAHRLLGIAYVTLNTYFTHKDIKDFAYPRLFSSLKSIYRIQWLKNTEHMKQTFEICKKLTFEGIDYVLLKGITLALKHYKDIGIREFSDTDIMVHTSQLKQTVNYIKDLGYVQGQFDEQNKTVVEASRKELITSPIISHEVVPLRKRVDHDFLTMHEIDVQFSMELMTGHRTDELVSEILENSTKLPIEDSYVSILNDYDDLLYVCIHYYKEATGEFDVKLYKDLGLYKACDLYKMISTIDLDWTELVNIIKKRKIEKGIYFTFYYLNEIFGDLIPLSVLNEIKPQNVEYLNQIYQGDSNELLIQWNSTVVERVFDMNRAQFHFSN